MFDVAVGICAFLVVMAVVIKVMMKSGITDAKVDEDLCKPRQKERMYK
jgi:hypothetical protein